MNHFRIPLIVLLSLMVTVTSAEIYRWVDENGQVHFGDKPGNADHEVIQQNEEDFSTIGSPDTKDKKTNPVEEDVTTSGTEQVEDQTAATANEELTEEEEARQKRIKEIEALAAELKAAREKRESKRDKEKEELAALREGCTKAEERIEILQKKIDHYITSQSNRSSSKRPEDITLDTKRQRMAAELKSRQEFVAENCDNL